MSAKHTFSLLISLILALAVTGCAAIQVAAPSSMPAIGTLETIQGLQTVARGGSGTLIYKSGDLVLMAWPRGANYAFAMMNTAGQAMTDLILINGKAINTYRLAELIKALESNGWKAIPFSTLPAIVAETLLTYTAQTIAAGVRGLPTIFLVPMYMIEPTAPIKSIAVPPLGVAFVVWFLQRRQVTTTRINYATRQRDLDRLVYSLPVCRDRFGRWLLTIVLEWVDAERNRLTILENLNITEIGTISQ